VERLRLDSFLSGRHHEPTLGRQVIMVLEFFAFAAALAVVAFALGSVL
jgi:hypothetical protein